MSSDTARKCEFGFSKPGVNVPIWIHVIYECNLRMGPCSILYICMWRNSFFLLHKWPVNIHHKVTCVTSCDSKHKSFPVMTYCENYRKVLWHSLCIYVFVHAMQRAHNNDGNHVTPVLPYKSAVRSQWNWGKAFLTVQPNPQSDVLSYNAQKNPRRSLVTTHTVVSGWIYSYCNCYITFSLGKWNGELGNFVSS